MAESRNYKMQIIYRGRKKNPKKGTKLKPATMCDIITTWVKDLMNAHVQLSTFFSSFSSMLAAKMGPLS